MMYDEFERLAGYEVSYDDYVNIIEPMYLATDLPKEDFVKCLNKKRFALPPVKNYIDNMKTCAADLKQTCTNYTDYETKDMLDELVEMYIDRVFGNLRVGYYYDEAELWSCHYPTAVTFYDQQTYKTYDKINFFD